jgi:hypothetical protein
LHAHDFLDLNSGGRCEVNHSLYWPPTAKCSAVMLTSVV